MGKNFYRFKTECWAPPTFKSYLWYPDIYVWVWGVGGGYFSFSPFMFECQGWVVGDGYFSFTPPPPHPQNLSHIYDTLTFMFECQGWGGGGWLFPIQPPYHPTPKIWVISMIPWHLCLSVWGRSHHIHKINFNKYGILIKIIFHFYFFQNKAVPSADM